LTPDDLLTTTRSVRSRLDLTRPVDLAIVKDCLRIAMQAPNGSNTQRWRWVVVTDPDQKTALAELYRSAWTLHAAGRAASRRITASARHLAENLDRVPVLMIPCVELHDGEIPPGNQAPIWGSLLPAVWSYMLAARARNLGTAWTTLHLSYEREAASVLGLPASVRQWAAALISDSGFDGFPYAAAAGWV
jgi:nitroreductase